MFYLLLGGIPVGRYNTRQEAEKGLEVEVRLGTVRERLSIKTEKQYEKQLRTSGGR